MDRHQHVIRFQAAGLICLNQGKDGLEAPASGGNGFHGMAPQEWMRKNCCGPKLNKGQGDVSNPIAPKRRVHYVNPERRW